MEKIQKARLDGAKVRAAGNGYAFFIPKALVDTDVIEGGKEYEVIINEIKSVKRENLNKGQKAENSMGPGLSLVRVGVQDSAFSGSKEDYLSGKFAIPFSEESWAEQFALGYPNYNFIKEFV